MTYTSIDYSDQSYDNIQIFVGVDDVNLDVFKKQFRIDFLMRNHELKFEDTDQKEIIKEVVDACFKHIDKDHALNPQDIVYFITLAKKNQLSRFSVNQLEPVGKTRNGKVIYPKTLGQAVFVDAMRNSNIVFATGVAGTGKTYLAVTYAVHCLKNDLAEKIILTRPAVEAGESLGFLPGDMKEKVDPYLRPLYDALYEMLGVETVERLMEKQIIEIAPLAFMRGRTLSNSIVILDEAQNTTQSQMKMFLTRMGQNTKMIINGDISQIDLIKKSDSGLVQATGLLKGIDSIDIITLSGEDVVRNPLVQKIIERYASIEK